MGCKRNTEKGWPYLGGQQWSQITRDERWFCQAFYSELCSKPDGVYRFLSSLKSDSILKNESAQRNEKTRHFENNLPDMRKLQGEWEPSFEVPLYRDFAHMLKKDNLDPWESWQNLYRDCYGDNKLPFSDKDERKLKIKIKKSLSKRTFDLSLFHKNYFIIIEAKAHGGFDGRQLESIKLDKKMVKLIFKELYKDEAPEILLFGLFSSRYEPKDITLLKGEKNRAPIALFQDVEPLFDATFTWNYLAKRYPDKKKLFERANIIYKS